MFNKGYTHPSRAIFNGTVNWASVGRSHKQNVVLCQTVCGCTSLNIRRFSWLIVKVVVLRIIFCASCIQVAPHFLSFVVLPVYLMCWEIGRNAVKFAERAPFFYVWGSQMYVSQHHRRSLTGFRPRVIDSHWKPHPSRWVISSALKRNTEIFDSQMRSVTAIEFKFQDD